MFKKLYLLHWIILLLPKGRYAVTIEQFTMRSMDPTNFAPVKTIKVSPLKTVLLRTRLDF